MAHRPPPRTAGAASRWVWVGCCGSSECLLYWLQPRTLCLAAMSAGVAAAAAARQQHLSCMLCWAMPTSGSPTCGSLPIATARTRCRSCTPASPTACAWRKSAGWMGCSRGRGSCRWRRLRRCRLRCCWQQPGQRRSLRRLPWAGMQQQLTWGRQTQVQQRQQWQQQQLLLAAWRLQETPSRLLPAPSAVQRRRRWKAAAGMAEWKIPSPTGCRRGTLQRH